MTTPITYTNPEIDHSPELPGTLVSLPLGTGPLPPGPNRRVFYFDIDNCLYERSTCIHEMMHVKISQFFSHKLGLNDHEAEILHLTYYKTYGLALEGLVRNHTVDALEYNAAVDDALDLKAALNYAQPLRDMLKRIRASGKYDYLWLMTNAYRNHALRVISFLGIGDMFDGLTYCRYDISPIICKPMTKYYVDCLRSTGIDDTDKQSLRNQSFVDDSELNVKAAHRLGFGHVYHFVESDDDLDKLKRKDDFCEYYGSGNNLESSRIQILRSILDLESYV